MISVDQLAEIVSRKVQLRRNGKRFVGLCPFHQEGHASFNVYEGKDGQGRYKCFSCGAGGDGIDWLRTIERKTYGEASDLKPDPELRRRREEERQIEQRRQLLRDVYPDLSPEAEQFLGNDDDPLTTLKFRLRRHLAR